jgi:hypothetical protein
MGEGEKITSSQNEKKSGDSTYKGLSRKEREERKEIQFNVKSATSSRKGKKWGDDLRKDTRGRLWF